MTTSGYPSTSGTDPATELAMEQRCHATATSSLHQSWCTVVFARTEPPALRAGLCCLHSPYVATPHSFASPRRAFGGQLTTLQRVQWCGGSRRWRKTFPRGLQNQMLISSSRYHDFLGPRRLGVQTPFTLGRGVRLFAALCSDFTIGWCPSWYRAAWCAYTVCVRATVLGKISFCRSSMPVSV